MKKTNAQLIARLREVANLTKLSVALPGNRWDKDDAPAIREATKLYRDTWLNPIIDEIEQRLCRTRKK